MKKEDNIITTSEPIKYKVTTQGAKALAETYKTEDNIITTLEPIKYKVTTQGAKALAETYKTVPEFDPSLGKKDSVNAQIIANSKMLNKEKAAIEKLRKTFKEPALEYGRAVDTKAKELQSIIEPALIIYKAAREQIDRYEAEQEQKRITAERERVERISAEITKIKERPLTILGRTSQEAIAVYDSITIPSEEIFQERTEEAILLYKGVMMKLEEQITTMQKREEAEKILAKEAELQKINNAKAEKKRKEEQEAFRLEKEALKAEREEFQRIKDAAAEEVRMGKVAAQLEEIEETEEAEEADETQLTEDEKLQNERIRETLVALELVIMDEYDTIPQHAAEDVLDAIREDKIPFIRWIG